MRFAHRHTDTHTVCNAVTTIILKLFYVFNLRLKKFLIVFSAFYIVFTHIFRGEEKKEFKSL